MERAQPLSWNESFAVGYEELDRQHRRLIDAINDVDSVLRQEKGPDELARVLGALRECAVGHIRRENALLWEIKSGRFESLHVGLPPPHFLKAMAESAFDEHMAAHDDLLARLDAIIGGPREALYDSLKSWFVDHAIKHDLPLKALFQAV